MLSTDDDSPSDALVCGEALSAVLLECTMAGFATCPVTHLTELSVSRELLAAVTDHTDLPQVLIRVGVVPALDEVPPPTPRRPLADVLRLKNQPETVMRSGYPPLSSLVRRDRSRSGASGGRANPIGCGSGRPNHIYPNLCRQAASLTTVVKESLTTGEVNAMASNSFGTRDQLTVDDQTYIIHRLARIDGSDRLPYSLKVLLENLVRNEDGRLVTAEQVSALAAWNPTAEHGREVAFTPARVLMQDFTGVPCVVDLVAMRDAITALGGDTERINPLCPTELVIDHSVIADVFGRARCVPGQRRIGVRAQR